MNRPLWNTARRDPRDMIGDAVVTGRDSLFRTRVVEVARVGNDTVSHLTLTRPCLPVFTR